jgi:fucose permease
LISLTIIMLWPGSGPALWIGAVGCGLFMASIFPTMLVLAGERLEISGRVTSWFLVGGGAGSMILPWIIGQAFVQAGTGALPATVLLATALTGISVFLFVSRSAAPYQVQPDRSPR